MNDLNQIIDSAAPTLLEFYATWCPHCKRMQPIVEDLKVLYDGKANIIQLDGEEHADLMKRFGLDAFPGWVLFKDGQVVWHDMGEKPASELTDMINRFV